MNIEDIILIIFSLLVIYLIYKTRNLEKLSIEQPTVETFEASVTDIVNSKYLNDINHIKNISNVAYNILREKDTTSIPAATTYVNSLIIDGSLNISNKGTLLVNIFPKYMIIAWADKIIPKGWALCNGNRYILENDGSVSEDPIGILTPDLRGRFVLGSGIGRNNDDTEDLTERNFKDIGGEEAHELTLNEIPAHVHDYITNEGGYSGYAYTAYVSSSEPRMIDYGDKIKNTFKTGGKITPNTGKINDGAVRDYSAPAEYTTDPHNNMPPYYVLIYIMKL